MLRFGITTRITQASGYSETRDSLAHDWSIFMMREFPNNIWVPLPNIGKDVVGYFQKLSLNVLILSGGDGHGETPERDKTEYALLQYALTNKIPIIGVCRGMQIIHTYFQGNLGLGSDEFISNHRARTHKIITSDGQKTVNSFHNYFLSEGTLNSKFSVIARSLEDHSIEAFSGDLVLAIMWHPERECFDYQWSTNLIKNFLRYD